MMVKSLFRKFFFALLWLWVISILAFWLSKQVPGDEVLDYLSIENDAFSQSLNPYQQREAYQQAAHKRGFDLPLFYFSLHKGIYPQSLQTIFPEEDRRAVKGWIDDSHNSQGSFEFYSSLRQSLQFSCNKASSSSLADSSCRKIHAMLIQPDINAVNTSLDQLYQQHARVADDTTMLNQLAALKVLSNNLLAKHKLSVAVFLPSLNWNGTKNQYHQWMSGLISLKPMISLIDGRNAWTKIGEALKWTLILNGLAFILAIFLGIVIGIWSGVHHGTRKEKWVSIILFTFFAIPTFWLATLMIFLLASGEWLSILPPGGLGDYQIANSIWEKWSIIVAHLILPVFCVT
ncbi:MAG TPA: ABC transporter permease, partial [Saprospiraceae bacterium]|nr:ABC transporter permease [Saprospiraceae bacterium]